MTKRLRKKRVKQAWMSIAVKLPATFNGKKDMRRWVSMMTNAVIREELLMKRKRA